MHVVEGVVEEHLTQRRETFDVIEFFVRADEGMEKSHEHKLLATIRVRNDEFTLAQNVQVHHNAAYALLPNPLVGLLTGLTPVKFAIMTRLSPYIEQII